jgi:hypothetical protein
MPVDLSVPWLPYRLVTTVTARKDRHHNGQHTVYIVHVRMKIQKRGVIVKTKEMYAVYSDHESLI